jgi:hypothetical protein
VVSREFGAVGSAVGVVLGALVDDAALGAREGAFFGIALDEVLPDLGADEFEQEAEVAPEGVIAQDAVVGLGQVVDAERDQQDGDHGPEPGYLLEPGQGDAGDEQQAGGPERGIAAVEHVLFLCGVSLSVRGPIELRDTSIGGRHSWCRSEGRLGAVFSYFWPIGQGRLSRIAILGNGDKSGCSTVFILSGLSF